MRAAALLSVLLVGLAGCSAGAKHDAPSGSPSDPASPRGESTTIIPVPAPPSFEQIPHDHARKASRLHWNATDAFAQIGMRVTLFDDMRPRACNVTLGAAGRNDDEGIKHLLVFYRNATPVSFVTQIVRSPGAQETDVGTASLLRMAANTTGTHGSYGQLLRFGAAQLAGLRGNLSFAVMALDARVVAGSASPRGSSVYVDVECDREVWMVLEGSRQVWVASQLDFDAGTRAYAEGAPSVLRDGRSQRFFSRPIEVLAAELLTMPQQSAFRVVHQDGEAAWKARNGTMWNLSTVGGTHTFILDRVGSDQGCPSCATPTVDLFVVGAAAWIPMREPGLVRSLTTH
jgi:hypothetical protein